MSFGNKQQPSEMSKKKSTQKVRGQYQIILNNDNVNTFDHVIDCLMEICGHNYYQALQCATLTHGAGKCSVFIDNFDSCENIAEDLLKEGLDVEVIKYINHV